MDTAEDTEMHETGSHPARTSILTRQMSQSWCEHKFHGVMISKTVKGWGEAAQGGGVVRVELTLIDNLQLSGTVPLPDAQTSPLR